MKGFSLFRRYESNVSLSPAWGHSTRLERTLDSDTHAAGPTHTTSNDQMTQYLTQHRTHKRLQTMRSQEVEKLHLQTTKQASNKANDYREPQQTKSDNEEEGGFVLRRTSRRSSTSENAAQEITASPASTAKSHFHFGRTGKRHNLPLAFKNYNIPYNGLARNLENVVVHRSGNHYVLHVSRPANLLHLFCTLCLHETNLLWQIER